MEEFNTFNDIDHLPLRVYNRAVLAYNLMDDSGGYSLQEYLNLFTQAELTQIYMMIQYIRTKGVEAAKKFATKDLVLEDEVA